MHTLSIETAKKKEVIAITSLVEPLLQESELASGWCHIFLPHTTAALSTADLDPGTDEDMLDAFKAMIPQLQYRHPHDPDHVPDHILSTLIGTSLTVPFEGKRLMLGSWQQIVLFEFNGPRSRTLHVSFQDAQP